VLLTSRRHASQVLLKSGSHNSQVLLTSRRRPSQVLFYIGDWESGLRGAFDIFEYRLPYATLNLNMYEYVCRNFIKFKFVLHGKIYWEQKKLPEENISR